MSNVDLAQEFTNLIVAQRGFQANSKVITTADDMLQDLVQPQALVVAASSRGLAAPEATARPPARMRRASARAGVPWPRSV